MSYQDVPPPPPPNLSGTPSAETPPVEEFIQRTPPTPIPSPQPELVDGSQEFVVDNERPLLSIALRNPEYLGELCSKITPDFFLFKPHRLIFLAMSSLFSRVKRIDIGTLNIRCDELGLDKSAQDRYLPLLFNSAFDESSFNLHLEAVKNAYLKYQLSAALSKSLSKVHQNTQPESPLDGDALIRFSSEAISKLHSCRGLEDKVVCFSERARGLVEERANNKLEIQGLKTGFDSLDQAINGLERGALTVVAARMKVGKSALLANIADHVAYESQQCSVLFISTEMKTDEDILRTLALRTFVKQRHIANGQAYDNPQERELLEAALKKIESSPTQIYHEYMPSFTVESVVARCKYWIKKIDNLGLIIFDYIKSPPAKDADHFQLQEHQLLGELTTALKNSVAGEEDIAVVTACQLNRDNEVADSDRIARFANTMLRLRFQSQEEYRKHSDGHTYGTHYLDIRETRSGGTGLKIPLRYYRTCLKFKEAELYEDEDEGAKLPDLETPLEQAKTLETKFRKPANLPSNIEMSMGSLIKGYTEEEEKQAMELALSNSSDLDIPE